MHIEARLAQQRLILPDALRVPPGVEIPFAWVRVRGDRAYVSGHGPQNPDGTLAGPFGKVGAGVSVDDARRAARLATLAMLGSLKRALGDLDRVTAWLRVFGMVNVSPGFTQTTQVINAASDLILALWGHDAGQHARAAVGMAELTQGFPVVLEAEVEIAPAAAPAPPRFESPQAP
jgi:enamine deaminase RidA (YjgF/YER057c/UK114 family)